MKAKGSDRPRNHTCKKRKGMVSESEHEWDRGRQGVWLRGYAARIGVATNFTAELWAWAVRTGLRIALARSFEKGYSKKKRQGRLRLRLLCFLHVKMNKWTSKSKTKNEEALPSLHLVLGVSLSLLQAREKESKGERARQRVRQLGQQEQSIEWEKDSYTNPVINPL